MEQTSHNSTAQCSNCGSAIEGKYCFACGQRVRDNDDRSLSRLLGTFLGNLFFIDNKFFLSMRYLLTRPGLMSVEFLGGKRKKFISPVSLFLFANLIYFIVSPLTDYSLDLDDQISGQPYSSWTIDWIRAKLETAKLTASAYAPIYQNMSDNVSKSIMIINVPMIAVFIYLFAFKKRKFYFDNLIFAFHYFTFFLLSWICLGWVEELFMFFPVLFDTVFAEIIFMLFAFFFPFVYGILSIKKFMDIKWYWAILAGIGAAAAIQLANVIYRFIILSLTLLLT